MEAAFLDELAHGRGETIAMNEKLVDVLGPRANLSHHFGIVGLTDVAVGMGSRHAMKVVVVIVAM